MPPIKILQVLGRLDRGGAETMLMNLYRRIDRNLVQFDFVIHTTDECDYSSEVRDLGGNIFNLKPFTAASAPYYRRQWRDFFNQHKNEYKMIHAHMRSTASIFLDEGRKAGITTIAHSHNTSSGKGISAIVKNILQKGIVKKADWLFSCSNVAGVWLYGQKAWNNPNHVLLKNGIEPENFVYNKDLKFKKRKELGIKGPVILHVGRFDEQKNHRFLMAVLRDMIKKMPDITVLLCGTGPLQEEIKVLADVYGIKNNVKQLGVRRDINELMQAADLMIFPSLFEGIPVTLIEAQCSGLPILMSERVDPEVKISSNVTELSLSEGPSVWSEKAIDMLKECLNPEYIRVSPLEDIKKAGYDAGENALWLQDFYLKN